MAQLPVLTPQTGQLPALGAGRALRSAAFIAIGLSHQLQIAWAVGSNSRDNASGVRPDRTRSTICRRNSGA
jgi:hypothetical protein